MDLHITAHCTYVQNAQSAPKMKDSDTVQLNKCAAIAHRVKHSQGYHTYQEVAGQVPPVDLHT